MFSQASIVGDIGLFLANNIGTLVGAFGSVALSVLSWAAGRFVIPFLQVKKRREFAQWIAVIADDMTDALVARYTDKSWAVKIDEAVDLLAQICGVDDDISRRAIEAAIARKAPLTK